ncbi:MAG: sigma 54-interacting transcriptional regulator [Candidatus Eisenbacteria bacterium]
MLDDIHLGGAELMNELMELGRVAGGLPLLLVCACEDDALDGTSAVSEVYAGLKGLCNVREFRLQRFSAAQVPRFIASACGIPLSDDVQPLAEWLYASSQGLPLVAEELLRQLASKGHLRRLGQNLTWELSEVRLSGRDLRASEFLQGRIDRLAHEELLFLQAASVFGSPFALDALNYVMSKNPSETVRVAGKLRELGLVRCQEPGDYTFSHPLTRSLLYERLDPETRREFHGRAALWLERKLPDSSTSELAVHYESSGEKEKALRCHVRALEQARRGGRHAEAFGHGMSAIRLFSAGSVKDLTRLVLDAADSAEKAGKCGEALALVEKLLEERELGPVQEPAVCLRKGRLQIGLSRFAEAQETYVRLLGRLQPQGHEVERITALSDLAWTCFRQSRLREALEHLEEAGRLASGMQMASLSARVANRTGVVLSGLGRLDESEKTHREAVSIALASGEPELVATSLNNLGLVLLKRGKPKDAERQIADAVENARQAGDLLLLAGCYLNLSIARKQLDDLDGALEGYLKSLDLWKRCGDLAGSVKAAINVAALYRLKGETELAERFYEEAYLTAGGLSLRDSECTAAGNLAEIAVLRGRYSEAARLYREALAFRETSGDTEGYSILATGLGYLFLSQGGFERAVEWARKAFSVSHDDSRNRIFSRILLAESLCATGRLKEAQEEIGALKSTAPGDITRAMLGLIKKAEGQVLEKAGDRTAAIEVYRSSSTYLCDAGDLLERARSLRLLGESLLAHSAELEPGASHETQGIVRQAIASLDEAQQILERIEAAPERLGVLSSLVRAYRELAGTTPCTSIFEDVDTLLSVTELLNSTLSLPVVLEKIMDMALRETGAERGLLVLTNRESGEIEKVLSRSMENEAERDAFEISRTVVSRVSRGGHPLTARDASEDPELKDIKSVARLEIRSILCVPLRARNKMIGAVYLDNRTIPGAFTPGHERFMEGFAGLAGMAIENSSLREELEVMNELLSKENVELRKQVATGYTFEHIVGDSIQMKRVFGAIEKVARSFSTVLIVGESGTGKELVARAIHSNSDRRSKPFLPVNCASFPRELIEGELFGIEDRVATGVSKRIGLFEQADEGTIFLDEIGDMSLDLQARLLRVLQDKEFKRVGGRHSIKVDVRIICATNKNLLQEIGKGSFRSDLYYRISAIPIELPPLRERRGDIPRLVEYFLAKYSELYKTGRPPRVSEEVMRLLVEADWGGNVRQLENCIERFVVMCSPGEEVPLSSLPSDLRPKTLGLEPASRAGKARLREELQSLEKELLIQALQRSNGNRSRAARELGVSEQSVRYKIRKYRLNVRQLCRDVPT